MISAHPLSSLNFMLKFVFDPLSILLFVNLNIAYGRSLQGVRVIIYSVVVIIAVSVINQIVIYS